jgi:hypothetical protein
MENISVNFEGRNQLLRRYLVFMRYTSPNAVHQIFLNFKTVHDLFRRMALYIILIGLSMNWKLVSVI